jgi:C4-dicarboxylate-specific signal transduction histidine kinase
VTPELSIPLQATEQGSVVGTESRALAEAKAAEALALVLWLSAVGLLELARFPGSQYSAPILLFAPLPLLIWAAVRFGARAAGSAALLLGALSAWGVLNGPGVASAPQRVHDALSVLTLYVIVAAALLTCTALLQQRKLAARAVAEAEARRRAAEELHQTALRKAALQARKQQERLIHLERVALIGKLCGAFGHELKQPLTSILGNAEAGLRILAGEAVDVDEIKAILHDIVDEDVRAAQLIQSLRDLLRKGGTHRQSVNVNSIIQQTLQLARSELTARQVRVSTLLNAHVTPIIADGLQLQQVMLNLLMNACEAMAETPAADRRLLLTTQLVTQDDSVEIAVEDSGCGIAERELEHIFQPFVTTKSSGLGLGLAICRSVAEAHQGRLWAENAAQGGAIFRLRLPTRGATGNELCHDPAAGLPG